AEARLLADDEALLDVRIEGTLDLSDPTMAAGEDAPRKGERPGDAVVPTDALNVAESGRVEQHVDGPAIRVIGHHVRPAVSVQVADRNRLATRVIDRRRKPVAARVHGHGEHTPAAGYEVRPAVSVEIAERELAGREGGPLRGEGSAALVEEDESTVVISAGDQVRHAVSIDVAQ